MRNEEVASWDWGKGTWGGRAKVFGTVSVVLDAQEIVWGRGPSEGPSAGSNRGSKRRREGREPESASTPSEPATRNASRSTTGTQSRQMLASESALVEEPVQTTCQMDEPPHPMFET
nr:hypothetical protein [Tanacetum cinerariifolium]